MKKLLLALSLFALPVTTPALMPVAAYAASTSKLGDLSSFETIATDTLALVDKGDLAAAKARITDFETAWDKAQEKLYATDKDEWGNIDQAADGAISSLRKGTPTQANAKAAVSKLIAELQNPAVAP